MHSRRRPCRSAAIISTLAAASRTQANRHRQITPLAMTTLPDSVPTTHQHEWNPDWREDELAALYRQILDDKHGPLLDGYIHRHCSCGLCQRLKLVKWQAY